MKDKTRFCSILVTGVIGALLIALLPALAQAAPSALPPRPTPVSTPTPIPTQPAPPIAPVGGTITLYASPVRPEMWTIIQWQDAWGDWHDVEGWQGTFNEESQVIWWVAPADLDTGPFRWTICESKGGDLLAFSESFYLPASAGRSVRVEVTLGG